MTLTEAVVDLDAIRHNTSLLSATATGKLMAVVKANAFGHGVVPVARTALASGAAWLGVTSVSEALEVRAAGIEAPVLAWMHLPDDDMRPVIAHDIDLSISSVEHLDAVAAAGRRHGCAIAVHLKVDTGLHRGGVDPDGWLCLVRRTRELEDHGDLRLRGLWSHLARADEPSSPVTFEQQRFFEKAVADACASGLTPEVVHLACSAAILAFPDTHFSLARAGLALYGVEPIPGRDHGLRPAMTLRAKTLMRRTLPAGAAVSYGHEYVTDRTTSLALVPLGFADGIPRSAGGRAEVLVDGRRCGVAGRVAMDQFVVDARDASVEIGDDVIVFGPGRDGEPTVQDWATWAGTNPHEILTGVGARVGRRYLPARGGSPRTRVAVVFGGTSAEHEVSCASGSAIISALDPDGYDVVPVLISPEGVWTARSTGASPRGAESRASVVEAMRVLRTVDVVIPALHGPAGEDGSIQGMLATLGVPFVGSGVLASAVGMDKAVAKHVFAAHGHTVTDAVLLSDGRTALSDEEMQRLGLPVFVKPTRAGSSQGVTRVGDWSELGAAVDVARRYDTSVLVEAAVVGREVDIAVLEHPDGRLEAGPPLEITYAASQSHFSYHAKYGDEQTAFRIPAELEPAQAAELQRIAVDVFELLGCRGLLRVDFLLGDESGPPVVNEVNTFPGFTTESQYPKVWAAAGLSYPELLNILVKTAMRAPTTAEVEVQAS